MELFYDRKGALWVNTAAQSQKSCGRVTQAVTSGNLNRCKGCKF